MKALVVVVVVVVKGMKEKIVCVCVCVLEIILIKHISHFFSSSSLTPSLTPSIQKFLSLFFYLTLFSPFLFFISLSFSLFLPPRNRHSYE